MEFRPQSGEAVVHLVLIRAREEVVSKLIERYDDQVRTAPVAVSRLP